MSDSSWPRPRGTPGARRRTSSCPATGTIPVSEEGCICCVDRCDEPGDCTLKGEKKEKKDSINIIADLTIGKRPFTDTYKSDVIFDKINDHIHVTNIDGPLNYLENNWKFIEKDNFTEVHFDVDFEIKNKFFRFLDVLVYLLIFQFFFEK